MKTINFWREGEKYLIRCVTHYQVGRLVGMTEEKELVLEDASWVPDTGRFHNALRDGVNALNEVEPFPGQVLVGRGAIVDAAPWSHELPTVQK